MMLVRHCLLLGIAFGWLVVGRATPAGAQEKKFSAQEGFQLTLPQSWEVMSQATLDALNSSAQTNSLGLKAKQVAYGFCPSSGVDERGFPRLLVTVDNTIGRVSDADIASLARDLGRDLPRNYELGKPAKAGAGSALDLRLSGVSVEVSNRLILMYNGGESPGGGRLRGLTATYFTGGGTVTLIAGCRAEDFGSYERDFMQVVRSVKFPAAAVVPNAGGGAAASDELVATVVKWGGIVLIVAAIGFYRGIKPVLVRRSIERELLKNPVKPGTPVTCKCEWCGAPIAFQVQQDRTTVDCPSCGQKTKLEL